MCCLKLVNFRNTRKEEYLFQAFLLEFGKFQDLPSVFGKWFWNENQFVSTELYISI